jgi:hypothetical protein
MKFTPLTKADLLFFIPLFIAGLIGLMLDTLLGRPGIKLNTHHICTIIALTFVVNIFYQSHTDREAIAEYNLSRGVQ